MAEEKEKRGPIEKGEKVQVVSVKDLKLKVKKIE